MTDHFHTRERYRCVVPGRVAVIGSIHRSALLIAAIGLLVVASPAATQQVEGMEPNLGGDVSLESTDPAVALERLRPADGYEVNLFASEADFPIGNPVALTFDSRGRLWVATMPTYPHYKPGDPPTDKLVVLEDTNGDGKADSYTVFADSLYLAAGFELGDGGVYVAQQPNLMFLRDTNGDGVADERRVILHGFGTEDSHHAISAFTWGPDGGLYMHEGTFHHSQVETPYGPVRVENAGVFRYEPHTEKLSVFSSYRFANPWGHVFDRWGQNFIADASGGSNYFALPISGHVEYPEKHPSIKEFTSRVRPTAGAEIVSSRHFLDDVQGNFLVSNVIGFHGIKNHRIIEEGSGFTSTEEEPILVSTDINFRPIGIQFGPDGALYVVDWFNPLIGHMQYSLRDPRRDVDHGRIWRVTYSGRPLLQPMNLEALTVRELLDQLRTYEDRTRYRVRRELRERDRDEIRAELVRWVVNLDAADPEHERLLLEALWIYQSRDLVEPELLRRLLNGEDHRARAAATRVLRYWLDRVDDPLGLLARQAEDEHPLVRLEAVVALSFVPDAKAAEAALLALNQPTDYYLDFGLSGTVATLANRWKPALLAGEPIAADNHRGRLFLLDRLTADEVAAVDRDEATNRALLTRDGTSLDVRRIALRDLATRRGGSRTGELLTALRAADKSVPDAVKRDLAALFYETPPAELRRVRRELERLAGGGDDALVRQAAFAALLRADGAERSWRFASGSEARTLDLLGSLELVNDDAVRAAMYPHVIRTVHQNMEGGDATKTALRRTAVQALGSIPGHEEERLALFGDLLERRIETDVAMAGAAEILASGSSGEHTQRFAAGLEAYARAIPAAERGGAAFEQVIDLGRSLGTVLPETEAERLLKALQELAVRRIHIRAVDAEMRFDVDAFTVEAGQEVELVFENADHMPHNLLVVAPGSRDKVGRAADAMAAEPDAFQKQFVPELAEVLYATRLLDAGQSETLRFRAPRSAGDYPFVCTFPGHWMTMSGTMQVVPAP